MIPTPSEIVAQRKEHKRAYMRQYLKTYGPRWRDRNRDRVNEQRRILYAHNREVERNRQKRRYVKGSRTAYNREYARGHRIEIRERKLANYHKNEERERARRRQYHSGRMGDPQYRSLRALWHRRYYERNREVILERQRKWRREHPESGRLHVLKRRSQLAGASGSHSTQEWNAKTDLFGGCCAYCGEKKKLERDHKIPLSRGGSNDIMNILPACRSCNGKKNSRTTEEFLH